MENVVLFCHIEKCAGTSLVKKLTDEMPFRAVNLLVNQNTVTLKELKKTKLLYGRPKVISGHSINPSTFPNFRKVYPNITTFTVLREPCARLISNYLHDRTRGVWDGNLHDYMSVSWKQNYLLRFLGGGDPEKGLLGYEKIDYKLSVKNINRSFPLLVKALGLPISRDLKKKNSFQQNNSVLPKDISVENGVKVGHYSISHDTYKVMTKLNEKDIAFYEMALKQEELWITQQSTSLAHDTSETIRTSKALQKLEWLYRNTVYKPFLIGKVGYHALDRNSYSPDVTSSHDAF
jgi:hypothetical protein